MLFKNYKKQIETKIKRSENSRGYYLERLEEYTKKLLEALKNNEDTDYYIMHINTVNTLIKEETNKIEVLKNLLNTRA